MHQIRLQEEPRRSLKQSGARKRTKQTNGRATDEADPSVTVQKINAYENDWENATTGEETESLRRMKGYMLRGTEGTGVLV